MKNYPSSVGALVLALSLAVPAQAGDWTLSLAVFTPGARTDLTLGVAAGATDGYDQGLDSPAPVAGDTLDAVFLHPEWGVTVAGEPVAGFHRDIRGTLPQDFTFEVVKSGGAVALGWDPKALPDKLDFELLQAGQEQGTDMRVASRWAARPGGDPQRFTVRVSAGDTQAPAAPMWVRQARQGSSLYVGWAENKEADLAGYRVHLGSVAGRYGRKIDVKKVNNYTVRVPSGRPLHVGLTAYDAAGNESPLSPDLVAGPATPYGVAAPAITYGVSGVVVDARTGAPLPGVIVRLRRGSITRGAMSDQGGRFFISKVPAGAWQLEGAGNSLVIRPVTVAVRNADVRVILRAMRR